MRARMILAAIFALTLAGCSDSTGPDSDPAGNYHLVSYNAHPLPYTEDGQTITAMLLRLRDDGTYSVTIAFREAGQNRTEAESGNWEHDGGSVILTDHVFNDPLVADYTGSKIIIDDGEVVLVFERD